MLRISIRELHMKTGDWVRKATQSDEGIIVMEHGKPLAKIVPVTPDDFGTSFAQRPLVEGFLDLPILLHDSAEYISEDRERV